MNGNPQTHYTENQLAKIILDAAFRIHTKTGPGLLETVYEAILAHELHNQGLHVERQVPIRIRYDDLVLDEGFRADLLVEDKVIVELKSVEKLVPLHSKQVLTQLRLSDHSFRPADQLWRSLSQKRHRAHCQSSPGATH